MRNQFIQALQDLCRRRSTSHGDIKWWFSDHKLAPHRAGSRSFHNEKTTPLGKERDADTVTAEAPALSDQFFKSCEYGY